MCLSQGVAAFAWCFKAVVRRGFRSLETLWNVEGGSCLITEMFRIIFLFGRASSCTDCRREIRLLVLCCQDSRLREKHEGFLSDRYFHAAFHVLVDRVYSSFGPVELMDLPPGSRWVP